ncbi:MAG TPA: 3-phosphoshikimate 1-carboxyvinyltransferase [Pyrinomonadaceae bacterium]|jgi:3-phosphoshikimate 1-carboxyvinyltransferase|nr:3-phosphoshikimate 1-carboxyvinyltransferase [Pyrinomonadaceae bacterium]
MRIKPARRLVGRCHVPGDKSISHRAALIAALANGNSYISNFSSSQDCAATLSCLAALGVSLESQGNGVKVEGTGMRPLRQPAGPLNCGNSGTTMRLLAGILASQNFSAVLTGDDSLNQRPMRRIIEPLERMGASIDSLEGHPPLQITGSRPLKPISYELPVQSAQVKTCVLLAGLQADGRTEIVERNGLTRDHTERMLQWFGASLEINRNNDKADARTCAVNGPASLVARDVTVPGDFSAAAFFIAAGALLKESEIQIEGIGLNPTRTQFLDTLRALGAEIDIGTKRDESNEPVGNIRVRGSKLREETEKELTLTISGQLSAAMIDELPLLAVVGSQLPTGLIIRDARELRFKETDRLAAVAKNLKAMGAAVEEFDDGLRIVGAARLRGAKLESFGDHRIVMAFAVAALLADGESEISGSECVAVSFPNFFAVLESLINAS